MSALDVSQYALRPPISMTMLGIESVEQLRHIVPSARTEVTQIDHGRLQGKITHFSIGGLPVDLGMFSLGVRSRGVVSDNRITIGMLIGRTGRVTHWSHDMQPADVVVRSPKSAHDARYYGGASVAVISLSPCDLAALFPKRLQDPAAWTRRHYRPAGNKGVRNVGMLQKVVASLKVNGTTLSPNAVEFWKRAIVEAMTAPMLEGSSSKMDGPQPSALRIVGKVEDYICASQSKTVHISEICSRVRVSRRTLHRAFHDALGLSPIAFLRTKRLCMVRGTLRDSDRSNMTVSQIAFEHGFANLGRFSSEYNSLFGEYPSQTLGTRNGNKGRS